VATGYKIAAPIIDGGGLKYLKQDAPFEEKGVVYDKCAFIGIDQGHEIPYFREHMRNVKLFDVKPKSVHGYDVDGLDVTKFEDSVRKLKGMAALFFDVAIGTTGRNEDPRRTSTDCSWSVNEHLFRAIVKIIEGVRPLMFTLKTFIPYYPTTAGPVYEEYRYIYGNYELTFRKTGKLHNDEFIIVGHLLDKPRSTEGARRDLMSRFREQMALCLAGNEVAAYCLANGMGRINIEEGLRDCKVGGTTLRTKAVSPQPAGLATNINFNRPNLAIRAYLNQLVKWHLDNKIDFPYYGSGVSAHIQQQIGLKSGPLEV
jgi:hypothetical protein